MNAPAPTTLADLVAAQAAQWPGLEILTFVSIDADGAFHERTRTYAELDANGRALARGFRHLGLERGETLALMMNNEPAFVDGMVAAARLGAPFVPIDPRAMGDKLAFMLAHARCRGAVCADHCLEALLAAAPSCPSLRWIVVVATGALALPGSALVELVRMEDLLEAALPEAEPAPQSRDDPMFLMFTSGTTGHPKAVVNTHGRYMTLTQAPRGFGLGRGDKAYTGLSLTHVNAQSTVAGGLGQAMPVVISRKFTKRHLWDICRRHGCTTFNLLGGMIPEVMAMPEQPGDADNPVRMVISSGMPPTLWRRFEQRFGVTLTETYGSTEGGGMRNLRGEGPVGSIGRPAGDWMAEILDESGQPCPPGVEGEICFRRIDGGPITVQYHDNPAASSEKVRGGWLHMGDLGHRDAEGWFFFHHRVGGGVRRNGDFVNTALVEAVLTQSPLVADAFVYGVATARNVAGEKTLVAAIVPGDSASFDEAALRAHCRARLERNDVPDIFQVLAAIPKTISEKPIESACIRLLAEQGLATPGPAAASPPGG